MPTDPGHVDPIAPVFLSYRRYDGSGITSELAWLLRSAGVPVWRDLDDLPPGDTAERLRQAIDEGISGAVLVVTPDIVNSEVVKNVEAPKLIDLHQADSAFALGIANGVSRPDGGIDYRAPDALLAPQTAQLSGVDQHGVTRVGLLETVRKMALHRVSECRPRIAEAGGTFRISVQTRNTPQVYDRTESDLDIRLRPSTHEKLPSFEGLADLRDTIGLLPDCVTRGDARRVVIQGGAHLSVALAIGCAVPSSRIGELNVITQYGELWRSGEEAGFLDPSPLELVREGLNADTPPGRPAVAAYIDLLEIRSDTAFDRFLQEESSRFVAWKQWRRVGTGLLDPTDGGAIASEIAACLRQLSAEHGNAVVHLLLRCPFPVAVLVGRLTNTLRLMAYEWDDSDTALDADGRPRYTPVMRLRTSAATGAIEEVIAWTE